MTAYLNCYWKQDGTNLPTNCKEKFEYWTKSPTIGQQILKKCDKNLKKIEI